MRTCVHGKVWGRGLVVAKFNKRTSFEDEQSVDAFVERKPIISPPLTYVLP